MAASRSRRTSRTSCCSGRSVFVSFSTVALHQLSLQRVLVNEAPTFIIGRLCIGGLIHALPTSGSLAPLYARYGFNDLLQCTSKSCGVPHVARLDDTPPFLISWHRMLYMVTAWRSRRGPQHSDETRRARSPGICYSTSSYCTSRNRRTQEGDFVPRLVCPEYNAAVTTHATHRLFTQMAPRPCGKLTHYNAGAT